MKTVNETLNTFEPQNADDQIPELLPHSTLIEKRDFGHTLVVSLPEDALNLRGLGRLLIINGKCRNEGFKLIFQCTPATSHQMENYQLDRLIWMETPKNIPLTLHK